MEDNKILIINKFIMKKSIVVFSFSAALFFTINAIGQEVHVVKLRETLSSIAHTYHVSVGDLMRYNGLNDKSKLQIGEKIKIPSKHEAKVKNKDKEVVETVKEEKKPVEKEIKKTIVKEDNLPPPAKTHVVEQGESLFHISQISKVPVAKLREWNNLPDYTIKIGQELFISKPTEDEVKALQPAKPATDNTVTKPVVEKVVVKKVEKSVEDSKPVQYKIDTETVAPVMPSKKVVVEETKVQSEEPKKSEPAPIVVEAPKPVKQAVPVSATDKGFFAKQFVSSNQEVTGTAGILKTSSGWLDKKYYVLMNNINPGTIVKITYNNNSVYAKVLEALPDVKEDEGLILRISNAAVSVLNITDNKFQVTIDY